MTDGVPRAARDLESKSCKFMAPSRRRAPSCGPSHSFPSSRSRRPPRSRRRRCASTATARPTSTASRSRSTIRPTRTPGRRRTSARATSRSSSGCGRPPPTTPRPPCPAARTPRGSTATSSWTATAPAPTASSASRSPAGVVVFGVSGDGTGDLTICGARGVLDDRWHHVAVERRRADGWMWLFVDGVLEAQADGPDGDVSYPDDATAADPNDPFLVLGAEKYDAGAAYDGFLEEVRISSALRYTSVFTRPKSAVHDRRRHGRALPPGRGRGTRRRRFLGRLRRSFRRRALHRRVPVGARVDGRGRAARAERRPSC